MPHPESILHTVASALGLTAELLISRSRLAHVAQARMLAAYAIHRLHPQLSLQAIGAYLGGREHSTIAHALSRAPQLLAADPALCRALAPLLPECIPVAARPTTYSSAGDQRAMRWWAAQAQPSYLLATA